MRWISGNSDKRHIQWVIMKGLSKTINLPIDSIFLDVSRKVTKSLTQNIRLNTWSIIHTQRQHLQNTFNKKQTNQEGIYNKMVFRDAVTLHRKLVSKGLVVWLAVR